MSTDARSWLRSLGALIATSMPLAEARERLDILAPLLAAEFDVRTFNPASLAFVARRCKFFPTFHELCEGLSEWRKENRSLAPASTTRAIPDNATGLTPYDRSWLAHYHRREAQGFSAPREADGSLSLPHLGTDPERIRKHTMSMIRQYAPRAAALVAEGMGR